MVLPPHKNNFNLLRLILASMVVYSHSFALLGLEEPTVWGRGLGTIAVHGFFTISGYLICQSFMRASGVGAYAWRRTLRILPGLVGAIIFSKAVAHFFSDFEGNPVPFINNGPIWTIPWEVACYAVLAVVGLLGSLNRYSMPAVLVTAWLVYLSNLSSVSEGYAAIAPLGLMFVAGAYIFVLKEFINLRVAAGVSFVCLLIAAFPPLVTVLSGVVRTHLTFLWGPVLNDPQVVYLFYLAALPFLMIYICNDLPCVVQLRDDVSYGVYLYGWPLAQSLIALAGVRQWTQLPFFLVKC